MKKYLAIIAVLCAFPLFAEIYFWQDGQGKQHYSDRPVIGAKQLKTRRDYAYSTVKKVFDGDTLRLEQGEKVRLIGINTPEVEHRDKPGEPKGEEAKRYLQALIGGKKVRLETDTPKYDKYQRKLAHVFTDQGEHLNLRMVEQGLATVNIHPPAMKYVAQLLSAQEHAERRKIGIWGDPFYHPKPVEDISTGRYSGWRRFIGRPQSFRTGRRYERLILNPKVDVRIARKNLSIFPDLESYLGKEIEVRGWVSKRKGTYSILARHPSALIVIDDKMNR